MKYPKPNILCSKCLGFDRCRYNGITIEAPYIHKLEEFCNIQTVCPEVEIGLGVPRNPIRIVKKGEDTRLLQSETLKDVTADMEKFCADYAASLTDIDGFILKFKSPSCGVWETKYYPIMGKSAPLGRGPGFFGKEILETYPDLPVETETRLTNFTVREHFLLSLFTVARFREIEKDKSAKKIMDFHASHKLLLLAYHQQNMRKMGKLLADQKKAGLDKTYAAYKELLLASLKQNARFSSHINVIQHAFGYFSKDISSNERAYLNKMIADYSDKKIPLSALRVVVQSYIIRFDIKYLNEQIYFDPYPQELIEVTDSGKGRDLKHV